MEKGCSDKTLQPFLIKNDYSYNGTYSTNASIAS